jgi:hypothetical protein
MKKHIVFYVWQSDLPNSTNRGFIEKALQDAAKVIKTDDTLEIEPVIDRDTQGVPGSPDISTTIFEKIASASVVVADVSFVNGQKFERPTPNPNVMIELGYAFGTIGYERVIMVFNNAFGDVEKLPFDLKMRRAIKYTMPEEVQERSVERKELQRQLENALRASLAIVKPEKPVVDILNGNASPPPLLITGSAASTDQHLWVLSGLVKVVNYTDQFMRITPRQLLVDGAEWSVHSFIFQELKKQPSPKLPAIVVSGSHQEDFRLNLLFLKDNYPKNRSGVILFQIDNDNELLPIKVQLGSSHS